MTRPTPTSMPGDRPGEIFWFDLHPNYHPVHTGPQLLAGAFVDWLEEEQTAWRRLWPERAARLQPHIDWLLDVSEGTDTETRDALREEADAWGRWEESRYRCDGL